MPTIFEVLPREVRGRIFVPADQAIPFLNQLLRSRGARPDQLIPLQVDVPPGPDRPPPEVPFGRETPAPRAAPVRIEAGPPVGFFPGFGAPFDEPTILPLGFVGPVPQPVEVAPTPVTVRVLQTVLRRLGLGAFGFLFPGEIAPGLPTPEEIRRMEEAFEPPQPEVLPEITFPTLPELLPVPRTIPRRRPQRAIPSPVPTPRPPIERRPFPVPPRPPLEVPPTPTVEPVPRIAEVPQPRPILPEDPFSDADTAPRTQTPPRTPARARPGQTARPGTATGTPPFFFLSPPVPRIDIQTETQRRTPTDTPADTRVDTDPLTPLQPEALPSQARRAARQCQEVTRRRRRKGKCREGFFRELPGRTQFITWRENDCLGTARRSIPQAIRELF